MKQADGIDAVARTRRKRPRAPGKVKVGRILVPVDFSESAVKGIEYALWLAELMKAKITLIHVIEPVYVASSYPATAYVPQNSVAEEKANHRRLGDLAAKFVPPGFYDKAIVRLGTPYHEITAAAKSLKSDLIVITTHGRTGLSHVLMGSTAERVVRHAPCPVLTVRRSD
jgi:nucleotide-binding universal stress UspA family protein